MPTFKELLSAPGAGRPPRGAPTPPYPAPGGIPSRGPSGSSNQGAAALQNQPIFRESIKTMKQGGGQELRIRLILRLPENTMKTRQARKAGKRPDFRESENTIKGRESRHRPPGGRREGQIRFSGGDLKYRESGKKERPLRMFSHGGGEKHRRAGNSEKIEAKRRKLKAGAGNTPLQAV